MSAAAVRNRKPKIPEFNPETNEPAYNWTKTSNRLVEELYPDKVSGKLQMAILLMIARHTWGADKGPKAYIPLPERRVSPRLKCTRQALADAISDAERRGLIESTKTPSGHGKMYRVGAWTNVLKYEKSEEEETEEKPELVAQLKLTLMPGRKSKPFVVDLPNGQKLTLRYNNSSGHPVCYSINVDADGVVEVSTEPIPSKSAKKSASPLGQLSAFSSPSSEENKELTNSTAQTEKQGENEAKNEPVVAAAPPTPEIPPAAPETDADNLKPFRLRAEYREFLNGLRSRVWAEHAEDEEFISDAIRAGQGVPVEWIEQRLITKFGDRYDAALRRQKPGLLLNLIHDARKNWRAAQEQKKRQIAEQPTMTDAEFSAWLDSLPPEDRKLLERQTEVHSS